MITRDFLMNADCKTAFGAIEESLLWSAEQRAASLAALACRPDEEPVWIFGYGSLMWNPHWRVYRIVHRYTGWMASRILPAPPGADCAPAGTDACTERGRTHHRRRLSTSEETLEQEPCCGSEMITGCYLPTPPGVSLILMMDAQ